MLQLLIAVPGPPPLYDKHSVCCYPLQCDSRNIKKRKTPKERRQYVEESSCISFHSKPHYRYVEESIQKDVHSSDVRIVAMLRFEGLNDYEGNGEEG